MKAQTISFILFIFLLISANLTKAQQIILDDDFLSGINNWHLFGVPQPVWVSSAFGRQGIFDNNGDPNNNSGGYSNQVINAPNGFTVEAAVYLNVTDTAGCWDDAVIGLTPSANPGWTNDGSDNSYGVYFDFNYEGGACWGTPTQYQHHAWFHIAITASDGTWDSAPTYTPQVSADQYIDGWHIMKFVVAANGYVYFYIDNNFIWQSDKPLSQSLMQATNVVLSGRSSGSAGKAYHDWVKVTQLPVASSSVTLFDDFLSGINSWHLFGVPQPVWVNSVFGRQGIFDNNGDPNNNSGGYSNQVINAPNGFTVEAAVYLNVTDTAGCWDDAVIGLTPSANPGWTNDGSDNSYGVYFDFNYEGGACWGTPTQYQHHAWFHIAITASDGTWDSAPTYTPQVSADQYIDGWHIMKFVVAANGYVYFYIDNNFIWQSDKPLSQSLMQATNVVLSGRSSGSAGKAYHDWVEVTAVAQTHTFGSTSDVSNYRIIGLPGQVNSSVSQFLTGQQPYDWNVYWDNGAASNYQIQYDGTSTFNFTPGRAFWILSKNAFIDSTQVIPVQLASDNTYSIPLHSGWNLISDPFDRSVDWSAVLAKNSSLDTNQIFYGWNGGWNYSTTMMPYVGYYFNNSGNLSSLKIPYDPNGSLGKSSLEKETSTNDYPVNISNMLSLRLESAASTDNSSVFLGINPKSKDGIDANDYYSPPGDFQKYAINIVRNELPERERDLFIEQRPEIGDGQEYNLVIKTVPNKEITLTVNGIENFSQYEIYLLDSRLNTLTDLKQKNEITLSLGHQYNNFKLYIGKQPYIDKIKGQSQPTSYELFQNYPNPFNPKTVIRFSLMNAGKVTIKVYSILGQLVKTLIDNKYYSSGIYEVEFDGSELASGVYLYRMQEGDFVQTKKLVLLK